MNVYVCVQVCRQQIILISRWLPSQTYICVYTYIMQHSLLDIFLLKMEQTNNGDDSYSERTRLQRTKREADHYHLQSETRWLTSVARWCRVKVWVPAFSVVHHYPGFLIDWLDLLSLSFSLSLFTNMRHSTLFNHLKTYHFQLAPYALTSNAVYSIRLGSIYTSALFHSFYSSSFFSS